MSIKYNCPHTFPHSQPLPPSYPSSSASFFPIERLYFCEECDSIRCDQCVGVEVASYYCPNCLFDVPSANVRADKNRCARSCFSCPQCLSSLSIQATDPLTLSSLQEAKQVPGAPYMLVCSGCKWSSRQIDWEFEKPTGIALQLQKQPALSEDAQDEFDALKNHLEGYINMSSPPTPHKTRVPSRHISHLTQMASKALHRNVPGLPTLSRRKLPPGKTAGQEKFGWDELDEYKAKGSWRELGLEKGLEDVTIMNGLRNAGWNGTSCLERRWDKSWQSDRMSTSALPQRIPLKTKLTKRCPEANCRHLLIQPDTKGTRMKIKMVAMNYLPVIEIGRRRRLNYDESGEARSLSTLEDLEGRKKDRQRNRHTLTGGVMEDEEPLSNPLCPGETYTFLLAFTNPLYDPIQIRLTQPHAPKRASKSKCTINIITPHFTISALKDAWAYDDEDEADDEGSEDAMSIATGTGMGFGAGSSSGTGTLGKKSRLSVLAGGGSLRDRRNRENGVEKKGNVSKIPIEVDVSQDATGPVEFDLEVRYTYRAEGEGSPTENEGGINETAIKEYKTFTFWARVYVGEV
ncbi:hypothetical protein L204_100812 [Cryptococcus depauperatus]|nr:dynactin 4 [Cryptococcus depauperatus CBS 7855]